MASPTQWTWVWVNSGSWWWDREVWHAAVHGVSKSQTQLSDWTELNSEINQLRPQRLVLQGSAVAKCFCHSCSLRRPSQPWIVAQDSDTSYHYFSTVSPWDSFLNWSSLTLPSTALFYTFLLHFIIYQFPTSEVCVQVSFASYLTWNLAFFWGYGFTWTHFERKFHIFYEPQSWEMEFVSLSLTIITLEQKLCVSKPQVQLCCLLLPLYCQALLLATPFNHRVFILAYVLPASQVTPPSMWMACVLHHQQMDLV